MTFKKRFELRKVIQHLLFIPGERTIDIVMKLILAATIIALSVGYGKNVPAIYVGFFRLSLDESVSNEF